MVRFTSAVSTIGTCLFVTLSATALHAAEVKVNGTISYVIVSNQSEKLADGRALLRLHDKGVVNAADQASPFHLLSQDCYETILLDASGNISHGGGHCVSFDKAGDSYWNWWHFTESGSKWDVYHGTGKFAGMTGGGTCKPTVNFPDRYTLVCDGTVVMK